MYLKFYNFKEKPFNVTSDPAFFFFSQKHNEAMSHLSYGVSQRKGVIVITGEIGTGKTTLCRFFLDQLGKNVKTAFMLNPYFPEIKLMEAIMMDFGMKSKNLSNFSYVWELNKFLLKEFKRGNNVVLVIDEAQNLTTQQLEQVRLLSNLETKKDKLIQIVLVGQPELNSKLDLFELRQLKQRIAVRYHIGPLEIGEIDGYINHRLKIAGGSGRVKFTEDSIREIAELTSGTPRLVNVLCDRALLAGFVADTQTIGLDIINKCAQELGSHFIPLSAVEK